MRPFLGLLFFLSGTAGLVYEVVWARYFSLLLGATALAQTLILATFMGGLALGNWFLGAAVDRARRPLFLYGLLEVLIGLYALTFPRLYQALEGFISLLAFSLEAGETTVWTAKFVLSGLLVLPPTLGMGGTLPVLVKYFTRSVQTSGREVALLYAVNSGGAVAGCLWAGFWLIRTYGLNGPLYIAAGLNLFAGAAALVLASGARSGPVGPAVRTAPREPEPQGAWSREQKIAIAGAGISGFAVMLFEVAWVRLLSLALGGTTYSFSLMLAAFISGLTLGSLVIRGRIAQVRDPFRLFGVLEILITASLIAALPVYERLPYFVANLSHVFNPVPQTFLYFETAKYGLCFLVMFLPTFFSGMALPVVSQLAAGGLGRLGRRVGLVFAVNTLGTLAGALLVGLYLLPRLGLKATLELGMGLNLGVGLLVLAAGKRGTLRTRAAWPAALAAGFALYVALVPDWNLLVVTAGEYRYRREAPDYREYLRIFDRMEIVFYEDGPTATTSVVHDRRHDNLVLAINGKPDASSRYDLPTQVLLAHLPLALRGEARQALVIGLGSGITAGSAITHDLEKLTVLELCPSVVRAARLFDQFNYKVLDDPRLDLRVTDAKTFFQLDRTRYDVIVSEPSNPWVAGVASLFSLEYFRAARDHLAAGGLMAQWCHLYEMDDPTFRTVVRTFREVFPRCELWALGRQDVLLLGYAGRGPIDPAVVRRALARPAVARDLARIGLLDLVSLLSLQIMSEETLARAVYGWDQVHRDLHPVLDYQAPLSFYTQAEVSLAKKLDERGAPPTAARTHLAAYLRQHPLTDQEYQNLYRLLHGPLFEQAPADLRPNLAAAWYRAFPYSVPAALAALDEERLFPEPRRRFWENLVRDEGADLGLLETAHRWLAREERRFGTVFTPYTPDLYVAVLERLVETGGEGQGAYLAELAGVNRRWGRSAAAWDAARRALNLAGTAGGADWERQTLYDGVLALVALDRFREAEALLRKAGPLIRDDPDLACLADYLAGGGLPSP
ncbi:MAG: fused MFS/spermidine synthase [Thermodesulfobacteriota bacterium]